MTPLIEGRAIEKAYGGRPVLRGVDLEIAAGDLLVLLGPNGAGKSSLLRILGLLESPDRGTVLVRGTPIRTSAERGHWRKAITTMFQESLLYTGSALENVTMGLRFRGIPRAEATRRALPLLERLGVAGVRDQPAQTLSGGEAQRVSLARALTIQPKVLLLDEPFAALDQPTREALREDLKQLLRDLGVSALFVTHDRTEALTLGNRIAVMMEGTLLQVGPPALVFGHPASETVAHFLGTENTLPGIVKGVHGGVATIACGGALLEAAGEARVGDAVYLCLRPEDVIVGQHPVPGSRSSARNTLLGRVKQVSPWGLHYRIQILFGDDGHLVALITRPSFAELALEPGSPVTVSFKATAAHLIRRG